MASPRRIFLVAVAGAAGGVGGLAHGQSRVDEADDTAVALGYRHDTNQVDAKKYPQHLATQHCAGCQFWQGAAGDAWSGCAMFGRKQIAAGGWCLAYKKA